MKTQLLQDLEESGAGAVPRQLPARTARPQVWRWPQGPAQAGGRAESGVARSAPPSPPRSAPPVAIPQPPAPAAAAAPSTSDSAAIPGWLAERLREDAERDARAQWRATWQRRAVAWSLGTFGLALAAAGGLWLVEQNRVDGALVVVAKTTPEVRAAPVARLPVAVAQVPEPVPAPPAAEPVVADAAAEPFEPVQPPALAAAAPPKPQTRAVRRKTPEARPAPARRTVVARAPAEPSARQRREETLLQCRAHGYSERQCQRRACEMTRYGFACKG